MRADGLLHAELLEVVARLGHGQTLVIADAGLPIAPSSQRIDLALRPGLPTLAAVLETVLAAGIFESATRAADLTASDPALATAIDRLLAPRPITLVPHERLKALAADALAVVRTGECTPFANVILRAGVAF